MLRELTWEFKILRDVKGFRQMIINKYPRLP